MLQVAHVAHTKESCHVTQPLIWANEVAHMNESRCTQHLSAIPSVVALVLVALHHAQLVVGMAGPLGLRHLAAPHMRARMLASKELAVLDLADVLLDSQLRGMQRFQIG